MEKTSTTDSTLTPSKPQKLYTPITMVKAKRLGKELAAFVKSNNLSSNIAGKQYIQVEGWQFIGVQIGLTQIITLCGQVAPVEDITEIKYQAVVEIINQQGTVVSRGFAWCSNKESKKRSFDEYAIASMAQTRAIGKAYRNILSWIVKMAGYEATPAEEMNSEVMEADLLKAKQDVLKAINAKGITKGIDIMDYIEKVIGKRVIETLDEAQKIIREPR